VAAGIADLAQYREIAAKPVKATPKAKRAAIPTIDAPTFWRLHGAAVEAVIAIYGPGWKCRAPMGETVLAVIPTRFRGHVGERGTLLKWRADHRFPAARYWPGGALPEGVQTLTDYPRDATGGSRKLVGSRTGRGRSGRY
jgi:hypothetical protein